MNNLTEKHEELTKLIDEWNASLWLIIEDKNNSLQDRIDAYYALFITKKNGDGWVQHYEFDVFLASDYTEEELISWFDDFYYEKYQTVDNADIIERYLEDLEDFNPPEDDLSKVEYWPENIKNLAEQMMDSKVRWWSVDW